MTIEWRPLSRWALCAAILATVFGPVLVQASPASRPADLSAAERSARIKALFSRMGEGSRPALESSGPAEDERVSDGRGVSRTSSESLANQTDAGLSSGEPAAAVSRPGELKSELLARFPSLRSGEDVVTSTAGAVSYHGWDGRLFLLDPPARVIQVADGERVSVYADDRRRAQLQISDFAVPGPGRLVVADNSRQALFLFENGRFVRGIRDHEGRSLFRHLDYLWADAETGRIGVYDSGRNRTMVFSPEGVLLAEVGEKYEPVFWKGLLIRIEKRETALEVLGRDIAVGSERRLFTVATADRRLLLDAWGAGTAGSRLVLVTYEAREDEDNPDGGRVLLLGDGVSEARPIRMNLDLELAPRRPFATVRRGGANWLIEAQPGETGPCIYGFRLP